MDIKQAAQAERDTVSMEQIIALYGYEIQKGGFIRCPFHNEKTASLKIFSGRHDRSGWHCFGCGKGGSIIDFVMLHENCNFPTAVTAIDNALHLGLTGHDDPFTFRKQRELQTALDNFVGAVNAYCDLLITLHEQKQLKDYRKLKELEDMRNGHTEQISADDWTFMLSWKENDQYEDYLIQKIRDFKEEVASWRRDLRSGNGQ